MITEPQARISSGESLPHPNLCVLSSANSVIRFSSLAPTSARVPHPSFTWVACNLPCVILSLARGGLYARERVENRTKCHARKLDTQTH